MIGSQDKHILIDKLNDCIAVARAEHYKLEEIKAGDYTIGLWQGIRIGLQDAIRIIEGDDIPSCYKEALK